MTPSTGTDPCEAARKRSLPPSNTPFQSTFCQCEKMCSAYALLGW